MIAAVNARREANGLPAYVADVELGEAALAHSQDMVVREYLSHTNPDGAGLRDRLRACAIAKTPRFSDHAPFTVDYA